MSQAEQSDDPEFRFQQRDVFVDESPEVKGFLIVEVDTVSGDPSYRILERWNRSGDNVVWHDYWMLAEDLHARADRGDCAKSSRASEEQFAGFLELGDISLDHKS